ncbi:hypothetical protein [Mycolicibacterium vanbaalenii]|uniref:hypothetical protein n=1 Tax=Mycolicibacterium vanbaalenii TaxID=110539 RepID=UPI003CC7E54D
MMDKIGVVVALLGLLLAVAVAAAAVVRADSTDSMDDVGRRSYSEHTATDAYYGQPAWNWPN